MRTARREVAGLLGATLAHALMFALLARGTRPIATPPAATGMPDEPSSIEIEPSPAPAPDESPSVPQASAAMLATHGARETRAPLENAPVATAPSLPDAFSTAPSSSDAPLDLRGPVTLSNDALGLGGRNVFLGAVPGAPAASPTRDEAPANMAPGIQQSLRDALHDRDHDMGLDIGGPIVAVAEELTRPSSAPVNSRAVFEVTADRTGQVISVALVDVSEGHDEWEKVAARLRDALKARTLRVPGGSGGAVITLEVTSRWQLPSGQDPDTEVSVLGIPVKKAPKESKHAQKVQILKPDVKIVEAPADPGAPTGLKIPQYEIHIVDLLHIDVDPTNLAPRPLRVVHARVVREKVL